MVLRQLGKEKKILEKKIVDKERCPMKIYEMERGTGKTFKKKVDYNTKMYYNPFNYLENRII